MRRIEHPGPIAIDRSLSVDCTARRIDIQLESGASLLEVMGTILRAHDAPSGVARLHGGSLDPFVFVMPALSPTPAHAVYFSDRHEPRGAVALEEATVTLGRKDGHPWLHCHGTWIDQGGHRLGGHVLPNEARIAQPIAATIWLLDGAAFEVKPSPETAFSLFEPVVSTPGVHQRTNTFAMAVRANMDLCTALENECRARSIGKARILGGVGSLVGTSFDDGREVEPFVTEVFVRTGTIDSDASGALSAAIDVCVIDYLGGINYGRLKRGANAVLVTFELVIEALSCTQTALAS